MKRALILTFMLIVISSCSQNPEESVTAAETAPVKSTPLLISPAESTDAVESTATAESTTVATPIANDDTSGLPERDDTVGLADYCWQNPGHCNGVGDPTAPVILVEISDYGCGHCRNFNLETAPELDELYVQNGEVYWMVLPYALSPDRIYSATSAMCAAEQESFAEYHNRMFEIFSDADARTFDGFYRIAGELGLDVEAFQECVESDKYNGAVEQNIAFASSMGVNSTPTFVIRDQALVGNYPLEAFRQWIDTELESGSQP